MTSGCRNRLLLMSADLPIPVQYLTSRCPSTLVTAFPYPELPRSCNVGNDALVGVFISIASSSGNRLPKPSKEGVMFLLDDFFTIVTVMWRACLTPLSYPQAWRVVSRECHVIQHTDA